MFVGVRAHRRCEPSPSTSISLERIDPHQACCVIAFRVETVVATYAVTVDVAITRKCAARGVRNKLLVAHSRDD